MLAVNFTSRDSKSQVMTGDDKCGIVLDSSSVDGGSTVQISSIEIERHCI